MQSGVPGQDFEAIAGISGEVLRQIDLIFRQNVDRKAARGHEMGVRGGAFVDAYQHQRAGPG